EAFACPKPPGAADQTRWVAPAQRTPLLSPARRAGPGPVTGLYYARGTVEVLFHYGRGPALPSLPVHASRPEDVGWGVGLDIAVLNDVTFEKLSRDRQASLAVYINGRVGADKCTASLPRDPPVFTLTVTVAPRSVSAEPSDRGN